MPLAKVEDGVGGFGNGDGLGEEGEELASGEDAVVGILEMLGMVPEHFADGGAGVPAGVGVVRDGGAMPLKARLKLQMSRILVCTSGGTQE